LPLRERDPRLQQQLQHTPVGVPRLVSQATQTLIDAFLSVRFQREQALNGFDHNPKSHA